MNEDVVVYGMVQGTVYLEDLRVSVPHGTTVTISAARALQSKDLWRAISQRQIFRLQTGPTQQHVVSPEGVPAPVRAAQLAEENEHLRHVLEQQRVEQQAALAAQQAKLDQLLSLVQGLSTRLPAEGSVAARASTPAVPTSAVTSGVVEVEAPMFIPSKIRGEDLGEARVDVATVTKTSDVGDAAQALRRLRRGQ